MKKLFFLFAAALMTVAVIAQDIIYRSASDSILTKIMAVNPNTVCYKLAGYDDGPLFTINNKDIYAIRFANGVYQSFEDTWQPPKEEQPNTTTQTKQKPQESAFFLGFTGLIGYTTALNFGFEPLFGYEFTDRVAIGAGIGVILAAGRGIVIPMGVAEPFLRFCAWHNDIVFIDFKATGAFGFDKYLQTCQVGVRPSLRVRISEDCDLAADIGLFGAQYINGEGWSPAIGITATSAGLWFAYRF